MNYYPYSWQRPPVYDNYPYRSNWMNWYQGGQDAPSTYGGGGRRYSGYQPGYHRSDMRYPQGKGSCFPCW